MNGKVIVSVAFFAAFAVQAWGRPCFGYIPDWESADERSTGVVGLADFNGDGWQNVIAETRDGDGWSHVYYLKHWPALTIKQIMINGKVVPRSDYCFDARAGWYSFKEAPALATLIAADYVWSNRLDLFGGNGPRAETDARDVIYFNDGGELEKTPGWLSENWDNTCAVAEGDFDADGDVDVVIGVAALGYPGYIKIYKNTGRGLEPTPSWSYTIYPGGAPYGLAWGDVDNDGYLELAVADFWVDQFYVFKNNAGTLESAPSWMADYVNAFDVAWGDMDGDGDMDLAGGTYAGVTTIQGYAYVFTNNNGVLETTPSWENDPPPGRCKALAWGDVNGDGWLDLVKGICGRGDNRHDYYADIYYSDRGVLPRAPSWESEFYTHCMTSCLIDADNDGLLDLIQAQGSGVIGYFRKGATLGKSPYWKYGPGRPFHINDIRVGDVNADGYPDVFAVCTTSTGYPTGAPNKLFLNKANIGVNVKNFAASSCPRGVALRWEVNEAAAGFNLFRELKSAETATEPAKINEKLITGRSPYRYLDAAVEPGNIYRYWLEAVPLAGPAERHGPVECTTGVKASFALAQNAPNPARAMTTFAFSVPAACDAALTVYDLAGRKVATPYAGRAKAGANELAVDVSALAPGVYTYRLEAGGEAAAKRMVVVR